MSTSNKSRLDELRAKIGQQLPVKAVSSPNPPPESPAVQPERSNPAESKAPTPTRTTVAPRLRPEVQTRSGRGMQFYLDDTDRKIIHSLALWFSSQDRRVSDSQVIKAAIRLASIQQNARLLEIGDEVRAADRRLHKSKPPRPGKKA